MKRSRIAGTPTAAKAGHDADVTSSSERMNHTISEVPHSRQPAHVDSRIKLHAIIKQKLNKKISIYLCIYLCLYVSIHPSIHPCMYLCSRITATDKPAGRMTLLPPRGVDPGVGGSSSPLKICIGRVRVCFDPLVKNVTLFFRSKLLLDNSPSFTSSVTKYMCRK